MLSAKQGNYWYHLWYDAVLDWALNQGPPALEARTLPLGYRGVVFFFVTSHENTYSKGRALMQMYRVVPKTNRENY